MANIRGGSPDRFGYSWDHFSKLSPEQEQQFKLWTSSIALGEWRGRRFLDAGCGAGRNSYWPMKYGASSGVALDVDERSLNAASANLAEFPTLTVMKGSIYELPFENEFDIAFSIGVVHHLDNPELAVRQLARSVRPGGTVLIWVYGYENLELYVSILTPLRKALFSWMPLPLLRWLAFIPTGVLWLLLKAGVTPTAYLKLLREFPFMHLHHIVFDQMLPRIANYYKKDEAEQLLRHADLSNIRVDWVNECSWAVVGTKSA